MTMILPLIQVKLRVLEEEYGENAEAIGWEETNQSTELRGKNACPKNRTYPSTKNHSHLRIPSAEELSTSKRKLGKKRR
jgi:hypothetical protein